MNKIKTYIRNLFRVLTVFSVLVTVLVFFTGKDSLTEYIDTFNSWFKDGTTPKTNDITHSELLQPSNLNTDNLLTTICKTFFIILSILFFTIAAFISAIIEFVIWIVSWGDDKFYCTKHIWNLCWNEIFRDWYWLPSKSTYLWITFLLYSGLFGSQSTNRQNKKSDNIRSSLTKQRLAGSIRKLSSKK